MPRPCVQLQLTRKDFASDQEVRWCPGCGDYSILAQMKKVMPDFGVPKENIVFISRHRLLQPLSVLHEHLRLPHHPRPGADPRHRPEGGPPGPDGLGHHRRRRRLSIGGNHLIHSIRRNVDIKIVLFNNRIYGLTKGQYRRPRELGKKTKSTPGRHDRQPVSRCRWPSAAEATFVARSVDTHIEHLQDTLERAGWHHGSAFVEVYQNCNIFNDGAFASSPTARSARTGCSSSSTASR